MKFTDTNGDRTLTPAQREQLFQATVLIEGLGDQLRRIRAIGDLMKIAGDACLDDETLRGLGECLVDLSDVTQTAVDKSHEMVADVWEPSRIGKREARDAGDAR